LNISCLIVDDEPLARNLMTEYVRKVSYLNLVKACSSPLEALDILRSTNIDLIFLDVQMPQITGLAFLKSLQRKPQVILTTAYSQYAMEGYELDVTDYLLKPITFERFLKAVEKVSARLTKPADQPQAAETADDYIFVKDGTKLVKIRWDDILYVEGLKDYVTIHTPQQKIVSLQRLKILEDQLPRQKFMRVHNSFIIALASIKTIQRDKVQIGDTWIPIGDTYRKVFKEFVEGKQLQ
jgi:two-component system, LytTR family, response regulator